MLSKIRNALIAATAVLLLTGVAGIAVNEGAEPGKRGGMMQDGRAIFTRHVDAIGGGKAVRGVRSFHVSGTYHLPAYNLEGTIDLWFRRPYRLLYRVKLPGVGTIERGYDGRTAWSIHPQVGTEILEGAALDDSRRWALRGFSLLPESVIYASIAIDGKEEFNGRNCHRVKMGIEVTGQEYFDYYDEETGLFAGRIETTQSPAGEVELNGTAGDYRRFGDLWIPTRWTHSAGGQEWSVEYETFEINGVDAEVFEPPAAVRAKLAEGKDGGEAPTAKEKIR